MGIPKGISVVETMIGTRAGKVAKLNYTNLTGVKDSEAQGFNFPAQYMFKDVPWSNQARNFEEESEPPEGADLLLPYMEKHNIEIAMIGVGLGEERSRAREAIDNYPDRFIGCHEPDPNNVMGSIQDIRTLHADGYIRAISAFPAGRTPQVPINDPKMYALYATCVELDIPIFCCAGIPGPRVPFEAQHVKLIDEVMYDFPDLRFVTRHGCEPWENLAIKLMLKWPNLYYSTSAFAPKYYPDAVIDYANTRGADKIIYAGYFPMGLHIDTIFAQLPEVPFRDHVWPKFLRENAVRVLKLDI
ncbi:MAG: amidohydrolase family protein [Acidimicrobiales bacterium]|nr:amidohydrolase family protein [Acidimicrobiales bacterium]MDG1846575.1 amidohydrolase family protein [Acidimicrobiales bacterium]